MIRDHFHAALIAFPKAPAGHSPIASRTASQLFRHILEGPVLRYPVELLGRVGYLSLHETPRHVHREITEDRQDADHGSDGQRVLRSVAGQELLYIKLHEVLTSQRG